MIEAITREQSAHSHERHLSIAQWTLTTRRPCRTPGSDLLAAADGHQVGRSRRPRLFQKAREASFPTVCARTRGSTTLRRWIDPRVLDCSREVREFLPTRFRG